MDRKRHSEIALRTSESLYETQYVCTLNILAINTVTELLQGGQKAARNQ
jgi:hypothetical protein